MSARLDPEPVNHIAGDGGYLVELFAALTDEQLEEQLAFYRSKLERLPEDDSGPTASIYGSERYAAWRIGRWIGMVQDEQEQRADG